MNTCYDISLIIPTCPHRTEKLCALLEGIASSVAARDRFEVVIEGEPAPDSGMILDFTEISQVVQRVILEKVDHRDLNDFLENPTAELIVRWFWEPLAPTLPGLACIRLWELDACSVSYRGPQAG